MSIAAITCFYNPQQYKRLAANYWTFREHLSRDIPLTTVELSFDGNFMIPDSIQIRGTEANLMWQKERMLNLAIQSLPPHVDSVAWIDADALFLNRNWVQDTQRALEQYPVVQLFEKWHYLDADGRIDFVQQSYVKARKDNPTKTGWAIGAFGGAWAARLSVIPEGLEDRHILGGGDGMMLSGWEASFNYWLLSQLPIQWKQYYLRWAARAYNRVRGQLGYVKGDIIHFYHGTKKNRNYTGRWAYLIDYGFDPLRDITLDSNGLWKWSSDKPEMHQKVKNYFAERKEDD